MNKFSTIIFDLDGTLLDTSRDITNAINFLRNHYKMPLMTVHEVVRHVGRGVTRLLETAVVEGTSIDVNEARIMIIKYYSEHLLDETIVYPGINSLLESICNEYILAVASNKPAFLTEACLKGLGLSQFFKLIVGPETGGAGKPDPAMLRHISEKFGTDFGKILMVGDSPVDIEAAQNLGCASCAVTWGYNVNEVLHESRPDFIIHAPPDLLDYL